MDSYNYADRLVMHDQENGEVYVRVQSEEGRFHAYTAPADERQAAAQALAGDGYRVIPADVAHGCRWTDDPDEPCPVCGATLPQWHHEVLAREAQAAQPDRPEPVDPASVRVGDVVEIEADDGSWMVRGEVVDKDGSNINPIAVGVGDPLQSWPAITDATVRVLRRAEPEPDEAAVEALRDAMVSTSEVVTDPESGDYSITEWARELIKRGWGQVSTDA